MLEIVAGCCGYYALVACAGGYRACVRTGVPSSLRSGAFFRGEASSQSGAPLRLVRVDSFRSEGSLCRSIMRAAVEHARRER